MQRRWQFSPDKMSKTKIYLSNEEEVWRVKAIHALKCLESNYSVASANWILSFLPLLLMYTLFQTFFCQKSRLQTYAGICRGYFSLYTETFQHKIGHTAKDMCSGIRTYQNLWEYFLKFLSKTSTFKSTVRETKQYYKN